MSKILYSPVDSGCGGSSGGSSTGGSGGNGGSAAPAPLELHVCAGLNACKGHDRFGTNQCAGTGFCATNTHVCHTLNNCRGQGGCGLYGDAAEQCRPGENECAFQGSCATPIEKERFSTQGANQGKSVWILARKLFEERMARANRTVGAAPFPDGPPKHWLVRLSPDFDSCGASGDKLCTFGYNSPAATAQKRADESRRTLNETLKECDCEVEEKEKGDRADS